jgi:hypothetical protein
MLKASISKGDGLLLLTDTEADISLLKGAKLIGSTEYNPEGKVRVKSVNRSWIETHGMISATIKLMNSMVTHEIQLVHKQVDIPCNRILGRDLR